MTNSPPWRKPRAGWSFPGALSLHDRRDCEDPRLNILPSYGRRR